MREDAEEYEEGTAEAQIFSDIEYINLRKLCDFYCTGTVLCFGEYSRNMRANLLRAFALI